MAIQMRRGANSDFSPSKMLPGEIAVTTDGTRKVYAAFNANDVKEIALKEDMQGFINELTSVGDKEIELTYEPGTISQATDIVIEDIRYLHTPKYNALGFREMFLHVPNGLRFYLYGYENGSTIVTTVIKNIIEDTVIDVTNFDHVRLTVRHHEPDIEIELEDVSNVNCVLISNIGFLYNTTIHSSGTIDNEKNMDDYTKNGIYYVSRDSKPVNYPSTSSGIVIACDSVPDAPGGKLQIVIDLYNRMYIRTRTSSAWEPFSRYLDSEEINNTIVKNNMMSNLFASFKRFAVIGDSMAAGHVYPDASTNYPNEDIESISWVTWLTRDLRNTAYNFSIHGQTCKTFLEGTKDSQKSISVALDGNHDSPCYFIGLGLNDGVSGSISDIDMSDYKNNADSFYGNYAEIIQRIKEYYGDTPVFIFMITPPYFSRFSVDARCEAIREIFETVKVLGNIYLLDLNEDYYEFFNSSSEIYENTIQHHYTSVGYNACAMIIKKAVNKIIYENMADFSRIEWIPSNSYIEQ